jgi:hypothetical protein
VKAFLISIAAIFAAVPGLSTLVTEIGAPPGRKEMYGAILTFAGCFTLAAVFICRKSLRNFPPGKTVAVSAGLALAGLIVFTIYYAVFHEYCSVRSTKLQYQDDKPIYFPLLVTGRSRRR